MTFEHVCRWFKHEKKNKKKNLNLKVGRQGDEGTDGKEADWQRGRRHDDDEDSEDDEISNGKLP